jgi:hypothetical protein
MLMISQRLSAPSAAEQCGKDFILLPYFSKEGDSQKPIGVSWVKNIGRSL